MDVNLTWMGGSTWCAPVTVAMLCVDGVMEGAMEGDEGVIDVVMQGSRSLGCPDLERGADGLPVCVGSGQTLGARGVVRGKGQGVAGGALWITGQRLGFTAAAVISILCGGGGTGPESTRAAGRLHAERRHDMGGRCGAVGGWARAMLEE